MAYTKTQWVNGQAPAISADNLNKIENKLEDLDTNKVDTSTLNTLVNTIYNNIYPVGRTIMFYDNDDHSNYLGFTWERTFIGKTPVGIDTTQTEFNSIGKTGGSKTDNLANAYAKIGARAEGYMTYTEVGGKPSYTTNYMLVGSRGQGSDLAQTFGTELGGTTSTIQPYEVVAFWKRVQ